MKVNGEMRAGQGVWLIGEFRGVKPGRRWTDRHGEEHEPAVVSLLIGDVVRRVEYGSEDEAWRALGQVEVGETVMLPVYVRGPWDPERGRRGQVFFAGARSDE